MNQEILFQKLDNTISLLESLNSSTWEGYINIFCAIFLAAIAFVAVLITIKNFRISQKSDKIEEIYSIIEELNSSYWRFLTLYNHLKSYYEESDKYIQEMCDKKYREERIELLNQIQIENYFRKVMKLEILSRSYLHEKAQMEVLAFNRMYRDILDGTVNRNWMYIEMFWKEGFPSINKLNQYVDDLGNLLVQEIGSSKGNKKFREKLRKYTENVFKNNLGLKSKTKMKKLK